MNKKNPSQDEGLPLREPVVIPDDQIADSRELEPADRQVVIRSEPEPDIIFWPFDLFVVPGHENLEPSQAIDLTGKWRFIMFGPYIELAPGTWEATLKFRLDVEGGSNHLGFQWGGVDTAIVDHYERLSVSGDYEICMLNSWDRPSRAELRVIVSQPAFQGKFTFLECRIRQCH